MPDAPRVDLLDPESLRTCSHASVVNLSDVARDSHVERKTVEASYATVSLDEPRFEFIANSH